MLLVIFVTAENLTENSGSAAIFSRIVSDGLNSGPIEHIPLNIVSYGLNSGLVEHIPLIIVSDGLNSGPIEHIPLNIQFEINRYDRLDRVWFVLLMFVH